MLTIAGTIGNSAVAYKLPDFTNSNQAIANITLKDDISPFYVSTYLNSKYGKLQTKRLTISSVQPNLLLIQVKNIKVPILDFDFQLFIEKLYKKSHSFQSLSLELYSQAEQILLDELSILDWKPKHRLSFIKNFSDTQATNRIDAEYFQPMYEEMLKAVKSSKSHACLGDVVSIKKCIEPGSEAYQDSGIPFVRVSNLSKIGINSDNQQFLTETLYDTFKAHQPKKGEILLSKDASPGIAYHLKDAPGKMIPSSGILRLTVKDAARVNPEYLTIVLNSVIVQKQIERDIGGSIINHWLVNQVKNTSIPILPILTQKQISEKANRSFSDREQSRRLLDVAKHGVEMAIEKSEKDAQDWIIAELKKLNINL